MKKAAFEFFGAPFSSDFKSHFLEITRTPLALYHRAYILFGLTLGLFFFGLFKHPLLWPALAFTAVFIYQIARLKKAAAGLQCERRLEKSTFEQGAQFRIEYKIKNLSNAACPPFFIHDQTMYLALQPMVLSCPKGLKPGETVTLATLARVESPAGRTTMGPFLVRVRDELGLFESLEYFEDEHALEIRTGRVTAKDVSLLHPKNSPTPGDLEIAKIGQGINLLTIREYHDGDPMNRIVWSRSTQDENIFVKEFESDIARRVAFLIDTRAQVHVGYGAASTWEVSKTVMSRLCAAYLKAQSNISIITSQTQIKDMSGTGAVSYCERAIADLKLQYLPAPTSLAQMDRYIAPPCLIIWIAPLSQTADVDDLLRQMIFLKAQGYEPHICFVDPAFSIALVAKKFGSFREEAKKIAIDRKEIERLFARAEIQVSWAQASQLYGGVEMARHG